MSKMDPAGKIPDMIKRKIGKRMGNALLILHDYLKSGAKPEDIF